MLDINKVVTDMLDEQSKIMIKGIDTQEEKLEDYDPEPTVDLEDSQPEVDLEPEGDFSGASYDEEWGGR